MKYHEMTKNYIFREFECGLTKEQTAELCFKSVRTITEWDKGKPIPPECKRLMRISSNRDISPNELWQGFRMHYDRLELPTGRLVTAQEILTAIAILEINSPDDVRLSTRILKYARCINRIRDKK
ncbi:regulator [Vibrio fluvialis]